MTWIARFLIERPLLTHLALVFLFLTAIAQTRQLRRLSYPVVDFERMTISTAYPGASPESVELNVTLKIEEAIRDLDGIEKVTSRSSENLSSVEVTLDPDVSDPDRIKDEVRRAVQGVELPAEVLDDPLVFEFRVDRIPVFELALARKDGGREGLRTVLDALKKRILAEVDEVSRVQITGVTDREFQIYVDPQKLLRYQVALSEVVDAVDRNQLRVGGGDVRFGQREKNILTVYETKSPRDLENLILRSNDLGEVIRLKDVARVEDGFKKAEIGYRYNGRPGGALWVSKKGSSDVLNAVDGVRKVIREFVAEPQYQDFEWFSLYDSSQETRHRLDIVYSNAVFGYVLVLLILFYFLNRSTALWTAIGIPASMGISVIAMPLLGITINSISLCGLVIVLGMVVDDAIIISESIDRLQKQGLSFKEASIRGLSQVQKPVLATIVTTMIAFVPIWFFPGAVGKFSFEIPYIVILMLGASFLEATTFLPAHLAMRKSRGSSEQGEGIPGGERFLRRWESGYELILRVLLKNRFRAFIGAILFVLIGLPLSYRFLKFEMFPKDQSSEMWVVGLTSPGMPLDETGEVIRQIETILGKLPDGVLVSYRTSYGTRWGAFGGCSNCFNFKLVLSDASERDMDAKAVKAFVKKEFSLLKSPQFKELNVYIRSGGPRVGDPLEMQIIGNDDRKRLELMDDLKAELAALGIKETETNHQSGKEEYRFEPRPIAAAAAGVQLPQIAAAIRTAFEGSIASYYQDPDGRIDFRVTLDPEKLSQQQLLKGILLRSGTGGLVPIQTLVQKSVQSSPRQVFHYNNDRSNRLTANFNTREIDARQVYVSMKEKVKALLVKYPGFRVKLLGEAKESTENFRRIVVSFGVAVLAIYFILTLQFNSFSQPLMVISAIPFGVTGILIAFLLHGKALSILGLFGALGFTGVVVNDSLIMVDFMNRIRRGEKLEARDLSQSPFVEQVIAGARLRLRPILLTTLTTLVGLVPTAYGLIGGLDAFISPMVLAMAWGLVVGTSAVLIVIPVFYGVHADVLKWLGATKLFGRSKS